jgi:hypothetical protein
MQTGPRYVPLLRISLLQLEMVWIAIRDGTAVQQQQDNKVMDEADKETMAARRVSLVWSHIRERWQVYRSASKGACDQLVRVLGLFFFGT